MENLTILRDLTIISLVAVFTVAVLQKLRVPAIAGFITVGLIIGPSAFGLIHDSGEIQNMAEFGVILLMYGIGLELSVNRIKRLLVPILIGGGLQVVLTIAVAAGLALLAGYSLQASIFIGFVFSLSSTAVLIRALQDRGETDTPQGRMTIGILLFQDICVVPFLVITPLLVGNGIEGTWQSVLSTLSVSTAIIAGVVLAAAFLVPRIFEWISRSRQKELFMLTVFLVCIVTAWLFSLAGIKLALGAFFAGVIVAGSKFRHRALSEIMPFRIIFTSIFFVTVGMLLDLAVVLENFASVLVLLTLIIVGKFCIVFLVCLLLRLPLHYAIQTALWMAQVGEFSFILMQTVSGTPLLPEPLGGSLTAAAILSMLITPVLIEVAPRLGTGAMRLGLISRFLGVPISREAADSRRAGGHVIVVGYGYTGQKVSETLRTLDIEFLVVELNPENVRRGIKNGDPIYLGDASSEEILMMLGIDKAREIIISINNESAAFETIRAARHVRPDIHILVNARYRLSRDEALAAGADEAVIGEEESAAKLLQIICRRHGMREHSPE